MYNNISMVLFRFESSSFSTKDLLLALNNEYYLFFNALPTVSVCFPRNVHFLYNQLVVWKRLYIPTGRYIGV